jgi:hypothetical protein
MRMKQMPWRGAAHAAWARYRERGAALPVALALVVLLQVLALAQLDLATVALRGATGLRERVVAFYAADAALVLCAKRLSEGTLAARLWTGLGEPAYWRVIGAFEGAPAWQVAPSWPGTSQAPRCLIEMTQADGRGPRYLLTARAEGAQFDTQLWLQAALAGGTGRWFWRSVAGVPR